MSIALALLLQTEVGVPVDRGRSDRIIEQLLSVTLELVSCPTECVIEASFPFDKCPKCGVPMSRSTISGEIERSVTQDKGVYVMKFRGRVNGHALLRLAKIDAALLEPGIKRRDWNLTIQGPFQIHVHGSKDLHLLADRLKRVSGITSARGEGGVLFIHSTKADWDSVLGACSDVTIRDVTWTVNWDQGRIGFGLR